MEEFVLTLIHQLPEPWGSIALVVLAGIGASALAASGLPRGEEGSLWSKVRPVVDWIGANFGNAKNALPQPKKNEQK